MTSGRSDQRAHRWLHLVAGAFSVAVVGGLTTAAPARAADVAPPALVDVSLSSSAVSVAGLSYRAITVTVHLTDDTGVVASDDPIGPAVTLRRNSQPRSDTRLLTLATGSPTDGQWVGRVLVPSTYHGNWRAFRVVAMDGAENVLDVDPLDLGIARTLAVTGTHQPQLTFRFHPRPALPGQPVAVFGRLTDSTGRPVVGRVLFYGFGESCLDGGQNRIRTDSRGNYRFTIPPLFVRDQAWACVHLITPIPRESNGWSFYFVANIRTRVGSPLLQSVVRAEPETLVVAPGGLIRIAGNVRPNAFGGRVLLRRWNGYRWITESTAIIRQSGRYTIFARPPARGTFRYRVHRPSTPSVLGSSSPTMLLTAR